MLNRVVGLAASALLGLAAMPAAALEPKQCLAIGDMNATLRAEGMRSLVVGDRIAINDDKTDRTGVRVDRYANIVVATGDLSTGYQLEGDLPRAQKSTSLCVRAKLSHIRLFDARKPGTRSEFLLGGAYDEEVRLKEPLGTRPMVIADTVSNWPDGKVRIGLPMILFGNVAGRSGSLYARMADGKPQALMLLGDNEYTPYALAKLDGR